MQQTPCSTSEPFPASLPLGTLTRTRFLRHPHAIGNFATPPPLAPGLLFYAYPLHHLLPCPLLLPSPSSPPTKDSLSSISISCASAMTVLSLGGSVGSAPPLATSTPLIPPPPPPPTFDPNETVLSTEPWRRWIEPLRLKTSI